MNLLVRGLINKGIFYLFHIFIFYSFPCFFQVSSHTRRFIYSRLYIQYSSYSRWTGSISGVLYFYLSQEFYTSMEMIYEIEISGQSGIISHDPGIVKAPGHWVHFIGIMILAKQEIGKMENSDWVLQIYCFTN